MQLHFGQTPRGRGDARRRFRKHSQHLLDREWISRGHQTNCDSLEEEQRQMTEQQGIMYVQWP